MRQTTRTTTTNTAPKIPMKKPADAVIHVRVPSEDLETLKTANVNIPELVRQTFTKTIKQLKG